MHPGATTLPFWEQIKQEFQIGEVWLHMPRAGAVGQSQDLGELISETSPALIL